MEPLFFMLYLKEKQEVKMFPNVKKVLDSLIEEFKNNEYPNQSQSLNIRPSMFLVIAGL